LFIAITEYYIDKNWNYKEALLRFEHLVILYTRKYLTTVLIYILEHHKVTDQIFILTTDNASNNTILVAVLDNNLSA
jgi:hypothetical protein